MRVAERVGAAGVAGADEHGRLAEVLAHQLEAERDRMALGPLGGDRARHLGAELPVPAELLVSARRPCPALEVGVNVRVAVQLRLAEAAVA